MMGFGDGMGSNICKESVPHSRQITTPTPHHMIFTSWMLFLRLSQQCQRTKGNCTEEQQQQQQQQRLFNSL